MTDGRRILNRIREICKLGPRLPGSKAEQACQRFVIEELNRVGAGWTETERFDFLNWIPVSSTLVAQPGDVNVPVEQLGYSASGTFQGRLAYCGSGTKAECVAARDKIALCSSEPNSSSQFLHRIQKYRNAVEAGAQAFVLAGEPSHSAPKGIIRKRERGQIPAVSVTYQAGKQLLELDKSRHDFRITVLNRVTQASSLNVIWQLGGSIPATVFCAHYDSWTDGAWDNASGVAALLELAAWLPTQQLRRSVILCLTSGEEFGLFGSRDFCSRHAGEIAFAVNVDGVGYGSAELQARCGDRGLAKAPPFRKVFSDLPLTPWGDHWSFHRAGVRTVFLTCGGPTPIQHTPQDQPDHLTPQGLEACLNLLKRTVLYLDSIS